jgi:nicotinamide-nucleotide amidase
VRQETLTAHGAVSRETVLEMVSGAMIASGASLAVAVTGIAGPTGGTPEKPVGEVWIGWKRRGRYPDRARVPFRRRPRVGAPPDRGRALLGLMSMAD